MDRTRDGPLEILVVSALCRESGSQLRARYLARALERAGARVRLVPGWRRLPLGFDYLVSLIGNLRLAVAECDVIIGMKPLPNVTLPMLGQKFRGRLTVLDVDDVDFGYRTGWIAWLNRRLQCPFPARFALVTYHADRLREFIVRTFGVHEERLFQLPQGVDLDVFRAPSAPVDVSAERVRLGLGAGPIVAYTAHLNIASDLESIFDIVARVFERRPDVHFLVVGGGPRERVFRRMAKRMGLLGRTTFTGFLSPEAVVRALLVADVGLVYYEDVEVNLHRESMKLREMLALGLPIVCNDVGDLRRFERFTYQAGSGHEDVAAELVRVLEHGPDGRERAGMAFVRKHMDWTCIGERLLVRLRELMGS